MASGTRSGRILKHEGTRSSRSGSAVGKVKDIKGSSTSGSTSTGTKSRVNNSTVKDIRGSSTTSDSGATDSSRLRRSTRETPSKKMRASCPSSWKSGRLENQAPSTPSDTKKSERVGKKRPRSPLRRSERIEKHGTSSSSGSKKSNKSSIPLEKKKNKIPVAGTKEQSKNKKLDIKCGGSSKKNKRLDARSYRALLTPQPKKTNISDVDSMRLKDDSVSKGNSCNSGSSDSKKLHEGGDECNGRNEEDLKGKHSDDDSKEVVEGSSSGSRDLAVLTLGKYGQRKSACLSGKRKSEERSPVSKCSGSSSLSSLVGLTAEENGGSGAEREIDGEDDRLNTHGLGIEELEATELVASTSEGKSLAVDISTECGGDFEGSKGAKMAADLDSDFSVTPVNKAFFNPETCTADAASSRPSGTKSKSTKQCTVCFKLGRVHSDSQAQELCACNFETRHDLPISTSKKACELVATLGNTCEIETVATCSQENKAKQNRMPEAREHSSVSEKQNCLVASPSTKGRFGVSDSIGITEEHLSSTHLKEASVAIQTDSGVNACVVCKHPGLLLCCDGKGCKRRYHLSCLNPPLQDVPLGVWLCHFCVKKKVESGVYSVSEGIESVWAVKEGMQHGKLYFVKYKGLAHVHNRWILESQMLLEAPMLVAKFNRRHQKEKVTRWKQEWTEPHRLLQKRLLMPENLADEYFCTHGDKFSYCYHEWFVKWKGLGYDYATWEFENSPFLCSSEATVLIKNYESRHVGAKKASDPERAEKALQVKKSLFHKLTRLPDECPAGLDNDHLNSINRLREFWHKSQNAVFIDDQERIIKSILFISALQSHTCQPFLVISTIGSLSLWETEFIRLAPSINVVVYNGNKDIRKMIRTLEFYEEGGCLMFQVLLSHPDVIIEDFEAVDCIGWEAVIIDECQNSRVSKHLGQFKNLSTGFRLLLSGQLKDNLAEYLNLLSFLDSGGKENGASSLKFGSNDTTGTLAILKERLARYLAYERKPDSSKFLEYWVPVRLSNVQLEQYCATLVSNSITLRSCSKIDHVGALRNILISIRKCCDHPYLVDQFLQSSLTKGLPADKYLDIGVKASGKLLLLDKILHEIKKQGLRVLILFQSIGGAGRNSIGDILDDFLRQRFGADSYERVDSGLIMSKKLAALNMFNDKAMGRFVFLIENRACLPSIKLSSVDAVIIFDSDWNPLNDLRALQKISIESQFEHVKVFRLYSSCTVEEKVLIFAKQDMILESNIQNISPTNSHLLLSWGACYLFSELDEFHRYNLSNHSETSTDKLFLNDVMLKFFNGVVLELLEQLPKMAESSDTGNCSILIRAQQSGAFYSRNIILVGEKDGISSLDKDPPSFWSNLLERRYPKWRFVSEPSQKVRRKVQHLEESIKVPEVENDEVRKKRRKLDNATVDPISLHTWLQDKTKGTAVGKDSMVLDNLPPSFFNRPASISPRKTLVIPSNMPKESEACGSQANVGSQCMPNSAGNLYVSSMSDDAAELHKSHMVETERGEDLRNAQRSLHLSLKPELSKLCDTLKLPEDVKGLAHMFLEYIMNNHHVNRQSETILQAFKISLCWRASSFLKHKVDHKECLALAKKYLNFACNEGQADSVYSKLRMLKKKFSRTSALGNENNLNSSENQSSASRKVDVAQQMHGGTSNSAASDLLELGEIREISYGPRSSERLFVEQEHVPVLKTPLKIQQNLGSLKDVLLKKRVDLIDKICSKRTDELLLKEQVELSDFNVKREEEEMKLKSTHDLNLDLIRSLHIDYTVRNDKIKLLNQEFSKKMAEFDQHMKCERRKLAVMQEDARNKEHKIRDRWLEEAKSGTLAESFDNLPLTESEFRLEEFKEVSKEVEARDGSGNIISVSTISSDHLCSDMITAGPGVSTESTVKHLEIPSNLPNGRMEDVALETETPASQSDNMVEDESVEPTGTSAEIPATVLPAGEGDMPGETETSPSQSDVMNVAGTGSDAMLIDCTIVTTATTASQSNNMVEVESIEPTGTSAEILATVPPPEQGDMSMETETPSHSDMMNAAGNGPDAMLIDSTIAATATTVDRDPHEGEDNSDDTCWISSPLQNRAELPSDIINAAGNGPGALLIDSTITTTATTVDRDRHEGEYNSDDTCLISSPRQNSVDFPSLSHASTNTGCEISVSSNLVSFVSEHERFAVSVGVRRDCGYSSPQQIAIPALHPVDVVPSQVEPTIHNASASNSTLLPVPPSIGIFSVENGQGSTPALLGSGGEARVQGTHCFTQQTEVSLQQPIVAAAVQAEQSNQFVSQSVVHPLPPFVNMPPAEDLVSTGVQPEPGSCFPQIFPMVPWVPPQAVHPDPLQNELVRIRKQDESRTKMHEDKKLQLKLECDLEIEKIQRKYDALLQDAETGFLWEKKILETIYNKVLMNRFLAEQFRAKFIENKGAASASSRGPCSTSVQQFLQVSQPPHPLMPSYASSPVLAPNPTNLPPVPTPAPAPSTRPPVGLRTVGSVPSGPVVRHTPPVFPTNQARSHFSPLLPPRASLQVGTEPRAPAPHLLRFRPHTSIPAPNLPLQTSQISSHQQPLSNLGSATPVAPIPPAHPSMAPLSGTYQPVVPALLPVCRGIALSTVDLPRDVGDSNVGTDLPNASQFIEMCPSVDGWPPSNLALMGNELAASSMVAATPATAAAADLVCISDDE